MDSATTSAPRINPLRHDQRAFTLTEVIVAATLSSFVLAGVLSAFVFLGKTGLRASQYSEMDTELRGGLETFAQDVRLASGLRWTNAQTVTLLVPRPGSTQEITYGYAPGTSAPAGGIFYRQEATGARRPLIRGVADDFQFLRFKLAQAGAQSVLAGNDLETKQLQVFLRAERTQGTSRGATHALVSPKYILRNKRVSN